MTTELRKGAPVIAPHQLRHIGDVRLRADDGSLAICLRDGRRCFASAREIKASFFTFDVGDGVVVSVMQRENGPLLAFDVAKL
jgi:hypothetical protein